MASIFNKIDLINGDNTYSTLRMSNYGSINSVLTSNGNGTSDWADIYLQKSGGTMSGNIEMNDSAVKSTFTPNADDVLTNKLYVDSAINNINISSANRQFSTGLISGGRIIQNNGTTFNINPGVANINDINGNNTVLTWEEFTAQTILPSISTFVWINSSGEVVKSSTQPANSLLRSVIYLGVVNSNGATITDIDLHPSCVIHTNNSLMDFCFAIGHINLSGNNISKDPTTNLGLSKSSGNIFAYGSNFANNVNDPHILFLTNLVTAGINYYMQNGNVSVDLVDVNPNVLDTGTNYPSSAVGNNKWTIQRIYSSSSSNNRLRIIPGQFQYPNRQDAINAMATEIITPNAFVIAHSCILCFMVIKQGITVLNAGTNVLFYPQHNQLGGGSSVVSQTVLTDIGTTGSVSVLNGVLPYYNIRGIKANPGIEISSNSTDITLTNSSPASGITLSSVGTGTTLTSSTTNPNFALKSLTAGTGINFTGSTSTDLTINSVACSMGWSNYYEYNFSTITTNSPLNGQIRFNDISPAATHVYVSHITGFSVDIDFYLDQITTGDILYFQNRESSIQWVKYKVNGYTNYTNNYRDFLVEFQNSEGTSFTDNQNIIFTSYVNTAGITARLNSLEDKTQYQTTVLDQTNFAGTLYADYVKVNGGTSESYLMADGSLRSVVQLNNGGLGTSLVKTGTGDVLELNSISAFSGVGLVLNNNNISLSNTLPSTLITFGTSGFGDSLIKSDTNPDLVLKGLAVGDGLSISTTTDLITLTNTISASTLSNAGAGSSLIVSGSAPALSVKSLSASTGISISDISNNLQITNSSPASDITFSNGGTGTTLTSSTANPNFSVKSISASTGILITDASNNLQITNSSPASDITFSSAGTGTALTSSTTNPNFSVKSISASTGILITDASNNLQITNSSPASDITFSSVGTGTALTSSTTNPNFSVKSLTAGTGINFTGSTSTDLVINSTGGSSGTYTFANAGTGTTLVASTSGLTDFKTCSITAGSNVSLSSIGNDITISASGALGTNTINWTATSSQINYRLGGQALTGAQSLVNLNTSFYFNPSASNPYGAAALFVPNISLTGKITAPGGLVGNSSSATLIGNTTATTDVNYELLGMTGISPYLGAFRNSGFYFNPSASNTYGAAALFAPNISLTGKITAPGGFVGNSSSSTTHLINSTADNFSYNILGTTDTTGQTTPSINTNFYFNPSVTGGQKLFVPNIDCSTGTVTAGNFTGLASRATAINTTLVSANTNYNLTGLSATTGFNGANVNNGFYFNPSASNTYGASALFVPNISCSGSITATSFVGNASTATTATKTNNITGGLGGQLLFQSALDTTSKLANGTAGQILLSAGTTANPVWTTGSIKGWSVSFGGLGGINGYLQPNRFYDATAALIITSGQATRYIMPESATITKLSTLVQTATAAAQFRIITGTYASPSVKFTSTANTQFAAISGILTLATPIAVAAGEVVEIQIISGPVGTCMINLYFA